MTKFISSAATIALIIAAPASAQLLGGVSGGVGGMIGGGLGGIGTGVGGTLNGSIDRTTSPARSADRAARRAARNQPPVATRPVAATSVAGNATAAISGRNVASSGSASADITRPALQTRGITAATSRGLTRVAATTSGVPVFVQAAIPAPAIAVPVAVTSYPVYAPGAYYYGGPGVVVVSQVEVDGYMDRQQRDLERAVRGTNTKVIRRGKDLVLQMPADVTFAFDKWDIQPRFYGTLTAVARTLGDYPATDVEVMGHTDSVGSEGYNLALSERRGRSVADFLANRAVQPQRMVVEAYGEAEPVASNATITGRAANRRVEIVLHPREG